MTNSVHPDQLASSEAIFRSQLVCTNTVCKDRAYAGLAGLWLCSTPNTLLCPKIRTSPMTKQLLDKYHIWHHLILVSSVCSGLSVRPFTLNMVYQLLGKIWLTSRFTGSPSQCITVSGATIQYGVGSVSMTLNSTALMPPLTRNTSPLRIGLYASRKYGFKNTSKRLLKLKAKTTSKHCDLAKLQYNLYIWRSWFSTAYFTNAALAWSKYLDVIEVIWVVPTNGVFEHVQNAQI